MSCQTYKYMTFPFLHKTLKLNFLSKILESDYFNELDYQDNKIKMIC